MSPPAWRTPRHPLLQQKRYLKDHLSIFFPDYSSTLVQLYLVPMNSASSFASNYFQSVKENIWRKTSLWCFLRWLHKFRPKNQNEVWLCCIYVEATCNHPHTHTHTCLPFISHSVILASWLAAVDECFYPESKQDCESVLILSSWVKLKPIIPLFLFSSTPIPSHHTVDGSAAAAKWMF